MERCPSCLEKVCAEKSFMSIVTIIMSTTITMMEDLAGTTTIIMTEDSEGTPAEDLAGTTAVIMAEDLEGITVDIMVGIIKRQCYTVDIL